MEKSLYFLRHAIAVPRGTVGIPEPDRPLTDKGRTRMVRAVKGFRSLNWEFDALLSSPLLRAFQTAELVRDYLSLNLEIEIEETLRPEGKLSDLLKKLRQRPEQNILLTGHEPAMSSWIEDLLGCGMTGSIRMKKGALCHLHLDLSSDPPETEMLFLLPPRFARNLG